MKKLFVGMILAAVLVLPLSNASFVFGELIDVSTYGFDNQERLNDDEFIGQGLFMTSGDWIISLCNGGCVSANEGGEGLAYGMVLFNLVMPGTTINAYVYALSFDSVSGSLYYEVFDTDDNMIASGNGGYNYTGQTEISYFTVNYNYDGIREFNWESMGQIDSMEQADPVPEPSTIALLGMGMVGLIGAGARKRRKNKIAEKS